ncbi:UDP-glucose 4-epimerase GalE [Histidinibacterium aquaticum]|uniref:UDP-glucose 4-epimerase n=1 Tax=Histidinibacterium aquaticum TaxID=2613962 RepID=A0A5J5GMC6_9RHOB|nr:UDP-glucose 4-epimerase GalE [Histidinibacterium aquaticum]KAA9009441.1 UDP-glucose 4-epimerase GalE [Histidinibacterium aquaticum]
MEVEVRVLVTGGAGYIGTHVLAVLQMGKHDIFVADDFSNSSPSNLEQVVKASGRSVPFFNVDIRDTETLTNAMLSFKPEIVLHLAALKDAAESVTIPMKYIEVNVSGTVSLLRAMEASGCDGMVYSSSAAVYGEPKYLPLDEEHPCQPVSPYGESKWLAERIVTVWAKAREDRKAILLRYFNPIGKDPAGRIAPIQRNRTFNVMDHIMRVAKGDRKRMDIFGSTYATADGSGMRDFIHVQDLAEAHAAAVSRLPSVSGAEIINVGAGEGHTVIELIETFETATGHRIRRRVRPPRAGDIGASWSDTGKAARVLGWQARRNLMDICRSATPARYRPKRQAPASRAPSGEIGAHP